MYRVIVLLIIVIVMPLSADGVIYESTDEGFSWSPISINPGSGLNGVDYWIDGGLSVIVAVGNDGRIVRDVGSVDDQDSHHWQDASIKWITSDLNDVAIDKFWNGELNTVIAVGDDGVIVGSGTWGIYWNELNSGTSEDLYSIHNDVTGWWVSGANGTILFSEYGIEWEVVDSGTDELLFGIGGPANGREYAVGCNGTILYAPASQGWYLEPSGTNYHILDVSQTYQPVSMYYAVGQHGILLRNDNCTSWELLNSGTTETLYGVDHLTNGRVVVVGSNGTLVCSNDFGQNWEIDIINNNLTLHDIVFHFPLGNGYIVGEEELFSSLPVELDTNSETDLTVHYNSTAASIHINHSNRHNTSVNCYIYDITGKLIVDMGTMIVPPSGLQFDLRDISTQGSLITGLYYLVVDTSNGIESVPVLYCD